MSTARLQVKALDKSFAVGGGWRRARRQVLHGVDLRVDAGEVVAVVGESGSGKSTIARIIARLESADAGQVLLDGRDVFADEPRRASLAYRGRVQMVFQDPFGSLNPVHDVAHHLVRPLLRHGRADVATARAKAIELLEAVELSPGATFIDRYPHELSGGQRQRVAIARALAVEPDVVLADEPTSMLDVSTRLGVLELLRGLARSRDLAIVFITHDLASARHLADRVAVLYAGRLVEQGPTPQVLEHPAHPYTRLLLSSLPHGRGFLREAGADDALVDRRPPAVGCPFAPRCPHVTPSCRDALPSWRAFGDGHKVRCVHYPDTPEAS